MAQEGKVYNRYKNFWYELVFDRTIVLLTRDEHVYFQLPPELNNWKLRIVFVSDHSSLPSPIKVDFPENEIRLTLNNWYGDTGVQNTEPLLLQSKDGNLSTLTMIKTTANRLQNHRTLTITIWKQAK